MASSTTVPTLPRSMLYFSAGKPMHRSVPVVSDNVTYDLENSVINSQKGTTRIGEIAVRINLPSSRFAQGDIQALAALPNLDAIVVPNVQSAADLALVCDMTRHAAPERVLDPSKPSEAKIEQGQGQSQRPPRPLRLLAMIESAKAIMDLREICAAAPGMLKGPVFGSSNFAWDLSLKRSADLREMAYARGAIVTAARAAHLESVIDLPCPVRGPTAEKRLMDECVSGLHLGFNGKQIIHPRQLAIVQSMFIPHDDELEWAARVIVAEEKALATGEDVIVKGKTVAPRMIEKAHWLLAKAKQCGFNVDALRKTAINQSSTEEASSSDNSEIHEQPEEEPASLADIKDPISGQSTLYVT